MNTLGTDGKRNIDAVVDNQGHIVSLGDLMQLVRNEDQLRGLARFVSELDDCHAWRLSLLNADMWWCGGCHVLYLL